MFKLLIFSSYLIKKINLKINCIFLSKNQLASYDMNDNDNDPSPRYDLTNENK